jgi:preprotein translocase subunit SecY
MPLVYNEAFMKPYKNITYGTRLFLTILLVVFFNFILTIIPLPGLAKTSIKTFFTSFYMKQRLSVGGLGIEPILSAYFILSFLYYLFQWFEKKSCLSYHSF